MPLRLTPIVLTSLLLAVPLGVAAGLGGFTFLYARGASYLTNDPRACANCHVMREQYDGWQKSSHHAVAVCNDCHTPPSFFGKYLAKAVNGYHHSLAFTTGNFPDPIRIGPRNHAVTEETCRHCHAPIVQMIEAKHVRGPGISCVRCHDSVGHLH
jgi:cytochrome c nitrite reductase small subunit